VMSVLSPAPALVDKKRLTRKRDPRQIGKTEPIARQGAAAAHRTGTRKAGPEKLNEPSDAPG